MAPKRTKKPSKSSKRSKINDEDEDKDTGRESNDEGDHGGQGATVKEELDPDIALYDALKDARFNISSSVIDFNFNKRRVRTLTNAKEVDENTNGIMYWMSRDQRVQDNWAFLYAQRLAIKLKVPVHVCFCLQSKFLDATIRHFGFMMKGLEEVEQECKSLNIPFHLLLGHPKDVIPNFIHENNFGGIVCDFSPLRVPTSWVQSLIEKLPSNIPLCQVDAHNIVPCWIASDKLEYAARTIRNKIHTKLTEFLTYFPPIVTHPYLTKKSYTAVDWDAANNHLTVDRDVGEVKWAKPGARGGCEALQDFCNNRLKHYANLRNDPTKKYLSNLSPWFHFGQLSVQRAILIVKKYNSKYKESTAAFIEEAIIRRELADNFCFYNKNYDSIEGAPQWAKTTLNIHKKDKRVYLHTQEELEYAETKDNLWNAAQRQMVIEGKMHGFLRMYWAKKILEWTESPEESLRIAIYLNDKYNLDGRDPNGYVGCMWSICGVHDQGWAERQVFGKIRYMNYEGCKRKFNVLEFISKYQGKLRKIIK